MSRAFADWFNRYASTENRRAPGTSAGRFREPHSAEDDDARHRLAGFFAGDASACLDGHRPDDRDRALVLLTAYPNRSQLLKPAMHVVSGLANATSKWLQSDSRASTARGRTSHPSPPAIWGQRLLAALQRSRDSGRRRSAR
jgi:hypothetical protein